jgi:hypothetical protein
MLHSGDVGAKLLIDNTLTVRKAHSVGVGNLKLPPILWAIGNLQVKQTLN